MKRLNLSLLILCSLLTITSFSQENNKDKRFKVHTLAFYNLENLFDTVNDTTKFDEASPIMEMNADREGVYRKKVHNMARVLADIGSDVTGKGTGSIT